MISLNRVISLICVVYIFRHHNIHQVNKVNVCCTTLLLQTYLDSASSLACSLKGGGFLYSGPLTDGASVELWPTSRGRSTTTGGQGLTATRDHSGGDGLSGGGGATCTGGGRRRYHHTY